MPTAQFDLPFLTASQAQKHVTVNEALRVLDSVAQLSVLDRDLTAPPVSPSEGDRYIVASGATGAWSGWDDNIAAYLDGAWLRLVPVAGWVVWVEDESEMVVRKGGSWEQFAIAFAPNGSSTGLSVEEELLVCSGASVTSSIVIANRDIVLGVSTRTVTTVTGASSYDCGISGQASKFGSSLGVAAGSNNIGVVGPEAFYSPSPVVLTANGGDFTGGEVRIAIHCLRFTGPSS